MARARIIPVRHHSPRAAAVVARVLDEVRPARVLVEGPEDASRLIPVLTDPGTVPPVAILAYRTDGAARSSLWPFASYSPEWAALAWARAAGVVARFIDVPAAVTLADVAPGPTAGADVRSLATRGLPADEAAARGRGMRSFEELWEADFEAPPHDAASFEAALSAYARLVRDEGAGAGARERARDAWMARRIAEACAEVGAERVVAVVGAAHAAALEDGDVVAGAERALPSPAPVALTLIPYSYARLAADLGYGAGNRAPRYYQRAHEAGCDFTRASLELLIEVAEALRRRGFGASLADVLDAYRLATTLAGHRAKHAPGLDEVREAAVATFGRGEPGRLIEEVVAQAARGRTVGRVSERVGRNSLEEEFWREVRARKLPDGDAPETFTLALANEVEIGTSVFLHRLRVLEVPYAAYVGAQRARGRDLDEEAGGAAALARVREVWEAQWTPATDLALVEAIVLGETLADAAGRVLGRRLAEARTTAAAASVLLEAVVTAAHGIADQALAACARLGAVDDELPSLAAACRALSGLVAYGSSRAASRSAVHGGRAGDEALAPLLSSLYTRAVLRAPEACVGDDEAVAPAREALRTLHELATTQPAVDGEAWWATARALADDERVHASAAGLAAGLLALGERLATADVERLVAYRLSSTAEPAAGAAFLEGFLSASALAIVKSRAVVATLDQFLSSVPAERFVDVVPLLRRAFAPLGPTERRYLLENLVAARGLADRARAAQAVVSERDRARLKEMSAELAAALDDLDDL